ncbi:Hypothetical protein TPAR_09476 [Tolypocladium paradoxum]|uniref:Uncharacterized protein n=1 Tax=Tolypocladium paradoxum TaxID=94208 RepID=A0A2S4LB09_9HYPO|nr:Hypothetical protein TPAR_09476 [Tolypocladium paradoxum]
MTRRNGQTPLISRNSERLELLLYTITPNSQQQRYAESRSQLLLQKRRMWGMNRGLITWLHCPELTSQIRVALSQEADASVFESCENAIDLTLANL